MGAPEGNNNNPNIVAAGQASQFGTEKNDPKKARESGPVDRYSVRRAIKRITGAQVVPAMNIPDKHEREIAFRDLIAKELGYDPIELSLGMLMAIKKYQMALMGDVKAMESIENSVDGKLVEHKVETQVTWGELVEAAAAQRKLDGSGNNQ